MADNLITVWQLSLSVASLLTVGGASWALMSYRVKQLEKRTDGSITDDTKDAEGWRHWRREQEKITVEIVKDIQFIREGIEEIRKYIYNGWKKT